jgi:hypothetical protein
VRLIAIFLGAILFAACGKSKQEAALSLDDARLSIASARNAGAERSAGSILQIADGFLFQAEARFEEGQYGQAHDDAARASEAARLAQESAKNAPPVKPTNKPERQASRSKRRRT